MSDRPTRTQAIGGWTLSVLEARAKRSDRCVAIIPSTSRLLVATIRRTRHTERVQFTYCGKRISRLKAKELLEQ